MNNYDTCSTMEDLDLSVFWDTGLAQIYFSEEFEVIEYDSYYKTGTWFYTDCGQLEKPNYLSECYDFSKCTEKDFRAYCISHSDYDPMTTIRIMKEDYGTWKDYAIAMLDEGGIYYAVKDGFPDINNAELLYDSCSVQGYVQGDYANVLYKIEEYTKDGKLRDYFCNLFYDAPLYARLEVDEEEYYLEEAFEDRYEWDKDKAFEWIKSNVESLSNEALEWIKKNLPANPDYR